MHITPSSHPTSTHTHTHSLASLNRQAEHTHTHTLTQTYTHNHTHMSRHTHQHLQPPTHPPTHTHPHTHTHTLHTLAHSPVLAIAAWRATLVTPRAAARRGHKTAGCRSCSHAEWAYKTCTGTKPRMYDAFTIADRRACPCTKVFLLHFV